MSHTFRVWAPAASRLELEIFDPSVVDAATTAGSGAPPAVDRWADAPPHEPVRRVPLSPADSDWWEVTDEAAGPGTPYLFAVDDQRGRPDPRSAWQPLGVHGPSVVVDHGTFAWHDDGWSAVPLADALIYEAHVGTLTPAGTFLGAIDVLDELVELGVTHLELMPVAAFAGRWGWGYDGVDLFSPHPAYGTPDDLKALVDAAHRRGLALLIDCVYNHLGPVGAYLGTFGPYFTDTYATPWGEAVNVDGAGSDEVRRFVVDNALMWLRDYHVDGLRLDAVHAIIDTSAVHILEQLATEVDALADQLGRELVLIAESDRNDPRLLEDRAIGGYGLDAHWDDDFHHALHVALTGEQESYYVDYGGLEPLRQALRHAYVYRGQFSEHRDRHHGRPPVGLRGDDFVAFVQNHDQIGNRARGERASHLLSTPRLKVAAAVVATSPFVPMLFQGEEWAATAPFPYFADHHDDPGLADAVREGRLDEFAAFGWKPDEVLDPEDPETFYLAVLDRAEQEREPHRTVRRWYRDLLALRRAEPALRDGTYEGMPVDVDDEAGTLVCRRGPIVVALDIGPEPATLALPAPGPWELVLASERGIRLDGDRLWLPADSIAILRGPEPPERTADG